MSLLGRALAVGVVLTAFFVWYDFSMSNITRLSDSYWDEYWHCIGNDMFTNDSSGNPGHYQQLWMAAGYIPRYIPFPHTVRTWFNGKLVVCYKP